MDFERQKETEINLCQEIVPNTRITFYCNFCKTEHNILDINYNNNIARNGRYICGWEGGHISGQKLKKKNENPYAIEGKKECTKCKQIKIFKEFGSDKTRSDGYSNRCLEYRSETAREQYKNNKAAKKNADAHEDKHICQPCQMEAKPQMYKEEIKQSPIQNHGVAMPVNNDTNISTQPQNMFDNQDDIDVRNEKIKQTNLQHYDTEHIIKTDEGKKQVKQVSKNKNDHPIELTEQQRKYRKTVMERYGVTNVMHVPEFRAKMLKTTFERHGVEYYNQLPEMKNYLRKNCTKWLAESYAAGGPNKGIKRPEEWNRKQSDTMSEMILNGDLNPEDSRFYVTGYFNSNKCKKKKAFFRSSLELMMHYILDSDPDCEWYENEPFKIPYEKDVGIIRNYIPDFIVGRYNLNPLLIEIKPAFRMKEETIKYKAEVGRKYAETNNWEFSVIDEKYLKANCVPLEYLKKLPNVEIIKS